MQNDPPVGPDSGLSECDLSPTERLPPGTYSLRVSVPVLVGLQTTLVVKEWSLVVPPPREVPVVRWTSTPRVVGLETISVPQPGGMIIDEDMAIIEVGVVGTSAVRVAAVDLATGKHLSGTHRASDGRIGIGYHCQGVHPTEGRAYALTFAVVDSAGHEVPAPGPPLRLEKPESRRWYWLMVGNAPTPATRWWLLGIWGGGAAIVVAVAALLLRRRLKRAST